MTKLSYITQNHMLNLMTRCDYSCHWLHIWI